MTGPMCHVLCKLNTISLGKLILRLISLQGTSVYMSTFTLTAIAIDRSVVLHLKYESQMKKQQGLFF